MALASVCGFNLGNESSYFGIDSDGLMGVPSLTDALHMSSHFTIPSDQTQTDITRSLTADTSNVRIHFNHGTTTLAFVFQHGVIVAVDSRATAGNTVESMTCKKVVEMTPYLLGTISGGAADCAFWLRVIAKQARIYELRNHRRISIAAASKMFANLAYDYKGKGLSMGCMILGWDDKGPDLYYVDSDGKRVKDNIISTGSGSVYAYGVLDTGYRWDLSLDEALELARRAIFHACHRDAFSGGKVNVYHVKETGWERQDPINTLELMDIYKKQ